MGGAKEKPLGSHVGVTVGAKDNISLSESIRHIPDKVNTVYAVMIEGRMTGDEVVETISSKYEGFTKSLLSKVLYPERYGVELIPAAMKLLTGDTMSVPRKPDGRLKIGCRLTYEEVEKFREYSRKDGFETDQAHLAKMIRDYIKRRDKQSE